MKANRIPVSLAVAILAGFPSALQAGEAQDASPARESEEIRPSKSCPLGKEELADLKARLAPGTPILTEGEKQKLESLRTALEAALGCSLTERVECIK